jgi:DNA repair protein RadA/Sms
VAGRWFKSSLAKAVTRFVCAECGATFPKWAGKCEACGAWNSLAAETVQSGSRSARPKNAIEFVGLAGTNPPPPRTPTGIAEFDRVLGGGLVAASAILVGGDPGIGKSTLLLQAAAKLAIAGGRVLYISGEESIDQIRLRADRLGLKNAPVELAAVTNLSDIISTLEAERDAKLVVIDSIQTIWAENIDSAPGTVTQVRTAAFELIRVAKTQGFSLVLVGHVTK